MKNQPTKIFCFIIDVQYFAVPLASVDGIIMATAVSPVPNSSPLIHGLIDYHGMIVPVINLRYRLSLPVQPIRISDVFIIADTCKRKIALVADEAIGVMDPVLKDLSSAVDIDSGFEADGILRCDDGILLIYDIEKFLSAEEEKELQEAIDNQTNK